jgi:POT family proton-dependent oligopeptide transporter
MAAIDITTGETATIAEQAATYSELFYFLFKLGVGAGIVSLLLTPILKKMMHGIK